MAVNAGHNGKRTSTGCLTCRRRKKKCDEQRPVCSGCRKNDIHCLWGQPQRKQRLHRPQGYNKDFAVPQELSHCITVFAAPSMTLQQRLISHFADSCPIWISSIRVSEGSNFLVHLMPIAMRNTLVMDCLLAVAAGDLGKIGWESVELESLSNHHYARASAALSAAITKEMCDQETFASDDTLVAVLLLCVHEAVNFTSLDRLLIHINGAITLVSSRLNYTPENPDFRGFLLELFCYFFTLATLTHGSRIRSNDQFTYRVFHSPFLQGHRGRGMLLGTTSELFYILFRLSMTLNGRPDSAFDQQALQLELSSIQSDLLRISTDPICDQDSQNNGNGVLTDLYLTSKIYYIACQLLLYQVMCSGALVCDDLIRDTITQFFDTLEQLPVSSSANGVLCWPLFIAGLSSDKGKYRSAVLSRLKAIEIGWRSSIALQASKHLTQRWKECRGRFDFLVTFGPCSNISMLPIILV